MVSKIFIFVIVASSLNSISTHSANDNEEVMGNFADMATELFQNQGAQQLMQGVIGNVVTGALTGGDLGEVGEKLGQLLAGFGNSQGGMDAMSLLSTFAKYLDPDKIQELTGYIPMVMDFISSMNGPEAEEREKKHSGHSSFFPPILEKFHILFDHFMSSEFGKNLIKIIGAEKVIRIFADESGQFSYDKFVELIENQSFRRHWIQMMTLRAGKLIEHYSNPKHYEHYLSFGELLINSYLTKLNFPKSTMFDHKSIAKSSAALLDFVSEKYLGVKIASKSYFQAVFSYIRDLFKKIRQEAQSRGGAEGISSKLTDSINLDIIEPVAKVNRAYRYLKKRSECHKYVLCLVNSKNAAGSQHLPILNQILTKATSFMASWTLSFQKGISIVDHINIILFTQQNCQEYYRSECSDYHEKEKKVRNQYIHNEL